MMFIGDEIVTSEPLIPASNLISNQLLAFAVWAGAPLSRLAAPSMAQAATPIDDCSGDPVPLAQMMDGGCQRREYKRQVCFPSRCFIWFS